MLQIKEIKILNSSSVSDEDISATVESVLGENYLGFISKKNFLIVPKGEIEKKLLEGFIKLSEAKVFLLDKDRLAIEIKEREVKAKWCEDRVGSNPDCYFMDKEGLLFAPVPELFGNSIISFFGKLNKEETLGSVYTSSISFSNLLAFCESLGKLNFPVIDLVSTDEYYEVILKGGAKIYFDDKQDLNKTLENIQSLVESKTIETNSEFLNKLNHLDLRYGNKVHFDFR